jgi:hypothetical protein
MMEDRALLARQQREMLLRLTRQAAPAGHPESPDVRRAAQTLSSKRAREALLTAPVLAECLAAEANILFDEYAAGSGYPAHGGPLADAGAFGKWLRRRRRLPARAFREYAVLKTRRGWPVKLFHAGWRLTLVVRWRGRVYVW